jgi:putative pyruvate formate lyase activating enzyme
MLKATKLPTYFLLHQSGELRNRGEYLWEMLKECRLCPRECKSLRLDGENGFCGASSELLVASCHPHFGEEAPLVGTGGSGTIFLSCCNLGCVFCQNWDISHLGSGKKSDHKSLAEMMISLQELGCENINIVTPTHFSPHVILALDIAAGKGLKIPLVYNTSGYEKLEILKVLDGIPDIYLVDFKYFDPLIAELYSDGANNYPSIVKKAILEMHRQVGVALPNQDHKITRGLIIRHLVMPNHVTDSINIIQWISKNLPKETYINIMSQYRPAFMANRFGKINRTLSPQEYYRVHEEAHKCGLTQIDH